MKTNHLSFVLQFLLKCKKSLKRLTLNTRGSLRQTDNKTSHYNAFRHQQSNQYQEHYRTGIARFYGRLEATRISQQSASEIS